MSIRNAAFLLLSIFFMDCVSAAGLDDWFLRESGTTNDLLGIVFASNTFVAVGSGGYIGRSTDSVIWQPAPTDVTSTLYSVEFGSDTFVAVGNGMVLTSGNALGWVQHPQSNLVLRGVAYGVGRFVAVGNIPTGSNSIATALVSTNGTDWVQHDMGVLNEVTGVTFGNGIFVAVSGLNRDVLVSTNGAVWLRTETPCYNPRYAVAFGNSRFVAVGAEPYCPSFSISSSTDGFSWIDRQAGVTGLFFGVGFGGGNFVAVGGLYDAVNPDSRIVTSRDGSTWTPRETPTARDLLAVAFGNQTFVTVGKHGTVIQSGNLGDVSLSAARTTDGDGMSITVTGQSNWIYQLQSSTNLGGEWLTIAFVTNAQYGAIFTNHFAESVEQRYYRVIAP